MEKKTHWKKMFMGKYADMDLIDRKKLLSDLGYLNITEKELEEESEEAIDFLSFINEAEGIDPVLIVEEYEKNGNFEADDYAILSDEE